MKTRIVYFISVIIGSLLYIIKSKRYTVNYANNKDHVALNEAKELFKKMNDFNFSRPKNYIVKKTNTEKKNNAKNSKK